MNRRLISVLMFALVVAGLTSYVLYRLILVRVQSQGQGRTVATNRLVVAKHDIQVGALIQDTDVEEVDWSAPIPDEALKTKQDVIGRGAVATVYQNEPFLLGLLQKALAPVWRPRFPLACGPWPCA